MIHREVNYCHRCTTNIDPANTLYKIIFLFLLSFLFTNIYCQDSFRVTADSVHLQKLSSNNYTTYPYNKKRVQLVAATNIAGYAGILTFLSTSWYAGYPRSSFHFFNDNAEWLQVDKAGHVYGAYIESYFSNELWRWSGLERKKRIWISGLSGIAYQGIIETLDGFSSEYGWSWGDFGSNVLGSALFISQELVWDQQKIKLKYSFHKKNYGSPDLDVRADKIFGKSELERFLKDYNANTDWLTVNISSFLPESKLPRWLNVAFGYGAEGMFGARSNFATDKSGSVIFDRRDIERYRQWFLAPDVDLTRIRTNNKGLRIVLGILNAFKFPAPALVLDSKGRLKGYAFYF